MATNKTTKLSIDNIKFRKEPKLDKEGNAPYEAFDVANLAIEGEVKFLSIDGTEMPQESINYLIGYGIKQALQDSYASKTDAQSAVAAFDARLERLVAGELIFDGENGRTANPVESEMRALAETRALADAKLTRAKFVEKHGAKKLRALRDAYLEANEPVFRARAEQIVATRREQDDVVSIDLASMLDESEEEEAA